MPVCQRCGEDNPERARFCLACAAPLTDPAVPRRQERKRVSVLFCDLVGFTARSERLVGAGRRAEGEDQLRRALGFYREVGATAYLGRAEVLLAASA